MFRYKNYITINNSTYKVNKQVESPSDNEGYNKYVTYISSNNYDFNKAYKDIKEIMDDNSWNKEDWDKDLPILTSYHTLEFDEKHDIYIYTLMSVDYEYFLDSEDI